MQVLLWNLGIPNLLNFKAVLKLFVVLLSITVYFTLGHGVVQATTVTTLMASKELTATATLANSQSAVVRVETAGVFVPLGDDGTIKVGGGTAFIIDPSGIAVTNNHVVTGAAQIKVHIEGESKPRTATVLGVSECADLAVIKIRGNNFPYLEWRATPLSAGSTVYAAGFPSGTDEYTLEQGIVTQANTDGHTAWSSLNEGVLRHSARIEPGNSGGPLLDGAGRVVAINYAGLDNTNKYYAIKANIAVNMIEQLKSGTNIDSVGINGRAVSTDNFSGIWVHSVESGSPADNIQIRPGDIVVRLEHIPVATDGSMHFYCNVLRTKQNRPIKISVLRSQLAETEVLMGTLNDPNGQLKVIDPSPPNEDPPSKYQYIKSQTWRTQLPVAWSDSSVEEWVVDGEVIGEIIYVAPDVEELKTSWDAPGLVAHTLSKLVSNPDKVLDAWEFYTDQCTYDDRYNHTHTVDNITYTGRVDAWTDCGNSSTALLVLAINSETDSQVQVFEFAIVDSEADFDAYSVFSTTLEFLPQTDRHTATVMVSTANIRNGPTVNYPVVSTARRGDQLTIVYKQDASCSWLLVQKGELTGWISGRVVEAEGCPSSSQN